MKIDIDKIFEILEKYYPERNPFITYMNSLKDPFKVLLACILSLRTRDTVTYVTAHRLFTLGSNPEDFLKYSEEDIIKAIYPAGFYQNKAKVILNICRDLVNKYDSKVPDDIDELLKFKGVGRKTTNLVIGKGYGKLSICVDTHVHRICNRLGYVKTKTPDQTEMELRKKLPQKYWLEINELFITHGQNICVPVGPKCNICPITDYCMKLI
ncbi:MAG: endonuclease III [Candidatus Gastranaerophilales bacterium]|nr:endonuclease III [Candidatus Gastranaerophilales bacterium]